ncbi:MAG: type II secretion system minor pseudopilin GspK [Thermodesulfobacteriota bacterium]
MKRISPRDAGSVLVVTLLVSMLLTTLAITFSEETGVELSLSGFFRDGNTAYEAARSGVQEVLAAMSQDKNREVDSLQEDWARLGTASLPLEPMQEVSLTVKVTDESGKLNLNRFLNERGEIDEGKARQLRRLFRILGLQEERAEPLLDWLDRDDIERMNGAESGHYGSLQPAYACPNGQLQCLEQVHLVKGLGRQDLAEIKFEKDLRAFLTIYSDGKININTAPQEVLESLSDRMDASAAAAIIEYRKAGEFRQVNDLFNVPGVNQDVLSGTSQWLTVKSSALSIEAQGTYRDATCSVLAIAAWAKGSDRARLLYWQVR